MPVVSISLAGGVLSLVDQPGDQTQVDISTINNFNDSVAVLGQTGGADLTSSDGTPIPTADLPAGFAEGFTFNGVLGITLQLGDSADEVNLSVDLDGASDGTALTANLGSGANKLQIDDPTPFGTNSSPIISGDVQVTGGSNVDEVTIDRVGFGGAVNVELLGGPDVFNSANSASPFTDAYTIDLGSGSDTYISNFDSFNGTTEIQLGIGDDTAELKDSLAFGSVRVSGSGGNDVSLIGTPSQGALFLSPVEIETSGSEENSILFLNTTHENSVSIKSTGEAEENVITLTDTTHEGPVSIDLEEGLNDTITLNQPNLDDSIGLFVEESGYVSMHLNGGSYDGPAIIRVDDSPVYIGSIGTVHRSPFDIDIDGGYFESEIDLVNVRIVGVSGTGVVGLAISTSDGDDEIGLSQVVLPTSLLDVNLGGGDDTFDVFANPRSTFGRGLNVDAGDGDDVIDLDNVIADGPNNEVVSLSGGNGNDTITVRDGEYDQLIIRGNQGVDRVTLDNVQLVSAILAGDSGSPDVLTLLNIPDTIFNRLTISGFETVIGS